MQQPTKCWKDSSIEHPKALRASWLARPDARDEVASVLRRLLSASTAAGFLALSKNGSRKFRKVCVDAAKRNLARCRVAYRRMEAMVWKLSRQCNDAWQAFVSSQCCDGPAGAL